MATVKRSIENFPKTIDKPFLDGFLNKTVEDFCPKSKKAGRFFIGDPDNHCAHFVSHVLGFRFGELCLSEKWHGNEGRTMRVDELFQFCADRGPWSSRPATLDPCLIFATIPANVTQSDGSAVAFGQMPNKHVGIWLKGSAYNYHNGKTGPEGVSADGVSFFQTVYGAQTVCYYGSFPT